MGVFSSYSPIVLLDQVLWSMTQPRPSFTKLMYVLLSRTIVLLLLSRTIVLLLLSRTIVLMLVSLSRVPYYSGLFLWRFILCFRESTNFYTMNFDRIIIYAGGGGGGGGGVIHNTKKLNKQTWSYINEDDWSDTHTCDGVVVHSNVHINIILVSTQYFPLSV